MEQANNYASAANRLAKAHTEKWIVRTYYTDSRADAQYLYRSASGARKAYEYHMRQLAVSARVDASPMIRVELVEVLQ